METSISINHIPVLSEYCSWKKFDKTNYIMCIDDGQNNSKLYISEEVVKIIELIDGCRTLESIRQIYNSTSKHQLTDKSIVNIFQNILLGYGIFKKDDNKQIQVKDKYIWFKMTIFNEGFVNNAAKLLIPIFKENFFYKIFFISFLLSIIPLLLIDFSNIYNKIDGNLFANFIVINLITLIIHEFGHSAACLRFGAKSGKIGFGLYIMSPVFFSDVTDAWRLPRNQRLIVDLGGVYVQLIITSILTIIFFISHDVRILSLTTLILIGIAFNLNPFLRYDGYWALCDYFNVTNLRERSKTATLSFYSWCVRRNQNFTPNKKDILLIIYGNLSLFIVAHFIIFMIIFQSESIIYFPINFYNFIKNIVTDRPSDFIWYKKNIVSLLPFLAFYIMLSISFYKGIKKYYGI